MVRALRFGRLTLGKDLRVYRSRTAFAAGLLGPLLVLGGCSGEDPQPKIAPPESSAPTSASATPSGPVEPTMPAAAKQHNAAGAEAFVAYYWELVNYAQATGELAKLKSLGSGACQACAGGVAGLRTVFANGGTIQGGDASLSNVSSSVVQAGEHRAFQVTADIANTRQIISYSGKQKREVYPKSSVSARFIVDVRNRGLELAYWTKLS